MMALTNRAVKVFLVLFFLLVVANWPSIGATASPVNDSLMTGEGHPATAFRDRPSIFSVRSLGPNASLLAHDWATYAILLPLAVRSGDPAIPLFLEIPEAPCSSIDNLVSWASLSGPYRIPPPLSEEEVSQSSISIAESFWGECDFLVAVSYPISAPDELELVAHGSLIASRLGSPLIFTNDPDDIVGLAEGLSVDEVVLLGPWDEEASASLQGAGIAPWCLRHSLDALDWYVENIGPGNYAVLAPLSNGTEAPYTLLGAYLAAAKEGYLLPFRNITEEYEGIIGLLKEIQPGFLALVTEPIHSGFGVPRLDRFIDLSIGLDEDEFVDVPTGILTGLSANDVSVLICSSLVHSRVRERAEKRALILSITESIHLASKVRRELSYSNYDSILYSNEVGSENLTSDSAFDALGQSHVLTYLNLHGNPGAMALHTYGDLVLHAGHIPPLSPSLVITFSCETARFSDLSDPEHGISYSFIRSGAVAYVGARRLEYGAQERSTAYPELYVYSLLRLNASIGEVVKVINNYHIYRTHSVEGRLDPVQAAYVVLIGDPALRMDFGGTSPPGFSISETEEGVFNLVLMESSPLIYTRVDLGRDFDRKRLDGIGIELQETTLHLLGTWAYVEELSNGSNLLHIFITSYTSAGFGDLQPDLSFEIRLMTKRPLLQLIPYLSMAAVVVIGLALFISQLRRREKVRRPEVEVPHEELERTIEAVIRFINENVDRLPFEIRMEIKSRKDLREFLQFYFGKKIKTEAQFLEYVLQFAEEKAVL